MNKGICVIPPLVRPFPSLLRSKRWLLFFSPKSTPRKLPSGRKAGSDADGTRTSLLLRRRSKDWGSIGDSVAPSRRQNGVSGEGPRSREPYFAFYFVGLESINIKIMSKNGEEKVKRPKDAPDLVEKSVDVATNGIRPISRCTNG